MALDKFKRTDIIIDTIHPKLDIYTPLVAMQGEYNGRTLRVQLTNNGAVEPQTADMYFGFFHTETHQDGLYTFTKVDTNKGIYELSYPSEMLQVEGTCICQLKIVDIAIGRSISLTEGFSVTVKRSIIHSGMEVAENSIKIFDKALLDIREHERRILLIEANFKDLATMLSTNIPNIDVAISTRATQASVNAIKSRTDSYLDATISSRAPASTALSSSTWTSNLATALSNKFKPRVHKRVTNTAVAFDAIYTVLNVAGAGCLRRLYILSGEKYADIQFEIMILIDGRVLFYLGGDYSTGFLLRSAPDLDFDRERDLIYPSTSKQTLQYKERRSYGNDFSKQAIFVEPIYFNNSLQVRIQHKTDRTGIGYYGSYEIDYEVVV